MNVHSETARASPWPTPPQRAAAAVDPIVLQIVEGTLNSIEAEIEYAIERTARSPMIREAHDYRVGLFDRYCRKLTGRSYSAMPNAVVRDFPPETMRPGDIFLMNDTYLTEGSIGHLPDLCSTVPVFHDGEVVAYIQAFGHHDDIGGRVPGSMPGTARSVFEEGLAVPPVKLYSEGARNEAVFTIVKRNTRVPEMLAADIDSEVQACVMGARRMAELFARFGTAQVEACFQAILDRCRDIYRDELLPKIADGEYIWEDYVEHDGVSAPRLHKLALKMTKRGGRITLDFTGTDPQSPGPINWPAEFTETRFPVLVEKLALATDSAGAGKRRGGLGYDKHYRALVDCRTIVTADRVRLGCYGVNGGKAGAPFSVAILSGSNVRFLGGLVDGEPVAAGEVVAVRTTGGGGWGDPLEREPELVCEDVIEGRVSPHAARDDYGVVLIAGRDADHWQIDAAATAARRGKMRGEHSATGAMIDRGPGYFEMLKEGAGPKGV
jgi:N-methylhydantoinase B/oxoprolinase/acetone carboxylase alpha subunit